MRLCHHLHLAYCTNVHRGETWPETFGALQTHTLAVRERVCPRHPFAIGLRLSHQAAAGLSDPSALSAFRRWLDENDCYVFTINGFPYGQFHGTRVKEQVYQPDWTTPERLDYTCRLFDILAKILPAGLAGSVSTLPGSFKPFLRSQAQEKQIRDHLWRCVEQVARLSEQTGRLLHLGLEPEPLCLFENSRETIRFFEELRAEHPKDDRLNTCLGVNYDTCHFAVEFEEPRDALGALTGAGIRISKIHLSSALKIRSAPSVWSPAFTRPPEAGTPNRHGLNARPKLELEALREFDDEVYLHQVVIRDANGQLRFFRDLADALAAPDARARTQDPAEWRIHFHVPLHATPASPFENTNDHLLGVLDVLAANPGLCPYLEMETYTWEVLPPEFKARNIVEQLAAEYDWTLARLRERGLASR